MRQANSFIMILAFMLGGVLSFGVKAELQPGTFIRAEKLPTWGWSQRALNLAKAQMKLDLASFKTRSRVEIYRVYFATRDHKSRIVSSTGVIMVPADLSSTALPLLSYQHSTRYHRVEAPSAQRFDPESQALAILFASEFCLVAMADYLGLDRENEGPQFYLNAEIQSRVQYDLISAAHEFFRQNKILASKQLLIGGFSQGAHNSMALLKYIQQNNFQDYSVVATAALAGIFNLSEMADGLFHGKFKTPIDPVFLALALLGMHEAYDWFPRFSSMLAAPYNSSLPQILAGRNYAEISAALPRNVLDLFSAPYVASLVLGNPEEHPFWRALSLNNVDDFSPQTPLLFVHSPTDNVVPFEAVETSIKRFEARGAKLRVELLDRQWVEHTEAALPALLKAHDFFKEQLQ